MTPRRRHECLNCIFRIFFIYKGHYLNLASAKDNDKSTEFSSLTISEGRVTENGKTHLSTHPQKHYFL